MLIVGVPMLLVPAVQGAPTMAPAQAVALITASIGEAKSAVEVDGPAALENLTAADATFDDELMARALSSSASRVAQEWGAAMDGARRAATDGDADAFAFYGQVLLKLQYALAWMEAWHALNQTNDAQAADAWFAVVATKFAWNATNSDAAAAMAAIVADPGQMEVRRDVVFEETVAKFADKVLEETYEVGLNLPQGPRVALEKAGEGFGYFFGVGFVIEAERGPAEAALVEGAVRSSVAAAWRGDAAGAQAAADAVERSLSGFLGTDDLPGELGRMDGLADLIAQEYAAAVEGGVVVDTVEYAEALAFLADLSERWERIEPQAGALPGGAAIASQVDVALIHITADVEAHSDEAVVAADIAALRDDLTALHAIALGAQGGPPGAPAESNTGPWFTLGVVLGVMLGIVVAAVAFFAYLRRALRALEEPPAPARDEEAGK
jgi:hypothetical protein